MSDENLMDLKGKGMFTESYKEQQGRRKGILRSLTNICKVCITKRELLFEWTKKVTLFGT